MIIAREIITLVALNTIIALFLTSIDFGVGIMTNIVYSQSIGGCIYVFMATAYRFRSTSRARQVLVMVSALLAGAVAGIVLATLLIGRSPPAFLHENAGLMVKSFLFSLLFGAVGSYYFISRKEIATARAMAQEEKIKRLAQEKDLLRSELKLLQAQVEPHFLFNTLSTVISLVETDQDKAKAMLTDLSAFLRTTLARAREHHTTLRQELAVVDRYLAIMKIRMEKRLHYAIDVDAGLLDFVLPPMLVQPLVENAVKHGLEPKIAGGSITVSAGRRDGFVWVEVADSGTGFTEHPGKGTGLANIRERLEALYGGRARLTLKENTPAGVRAVLELPGDEE